MVASNAWSRFGITELTANRLQKPAKSRDFK